MVFRSNCILADGMRETMLPNIRQYEIGRPRINSSAQHSQTCLVYNALMIWLLILIVHSAISYWNAFMDGTVQNMGDDADDDKVKKKNRAKHTLTK